MADSMKRETTELEMNKNVETFDNSDSFSHWNITDEELDYRFAEITKLAIKELKLKGIPIARFDRVLRKAYLEFADGTRAYRDNFPSEDSPIADAPVEVEKCSATLAEHLALPYRMEIIPDVEEGGFVVCFPELKGCITCVETWEEIPAIALDAKKEWMQATLEMGGCIPLPKPFASSDTP